MILFSRVSSKVIFEQIVCDFTICKCIDAFIYVRKMMIIISISMFTERSIWYKFDLKEKKGGERKIWSRMERILWANFFILDFMTWNLQFWELLYHWRKHSMDLLYIIHLFDLPTMIIERISLIYFLIRAFLIRTVKIVHLFPTWDFFDVSRVNLCSLMSDFDVDRYSLRLFNDLMNW